MKEFVIGSNESNQRFDKLIFKILNQAPKSFGYKMLRKKNITLNGKKADGNEKLKEGDIVRFYLSDETFDKFSQKEKSIPVKKNINLDIVYEDQNILFVNKPCGMLSQKAERTDTSLNEYIISYLLENSIITPHSLQTFKPSIVNRLDRNTSGLVGAGKTLYGLQSLSEMFRNRTLEKHYLCIVKGKIENSITLRGFLKKNEKTNQVKIVQTIDQNPMKKNYASIETRYVPIETNGKVTVLDVELVTGKTHQIRAHLASVNHPILGDYKYGNKNLNQYCQSKFQIKNQLLHCYCVYFPEDEIQLSSLAGKKIVAPLPESFNRIFIGENLSQKKIQDYLEACYGNLE